MAGVSSTSAIFKAAVPGEQRHAKDRAFVRHDGATRHQRRFRRIRRHRRARMQDRRHRRPRHREENPDPARRLPVRGSLRGALYPNLIGVLLRGAGFAKSTSGSTEYTHSFTWPSARIALVDRAFDARRPRTPRNGRATQPLDLRGRHAGHSATPGNW